jgi:hypothetical protein
MTTSISNMRSRVDPWVRWVDSVLSDRVVVAVTVRVKRNIF